MQNGAVLIHMYIGHIAVDMIVPWQAWRSSTSRIFLRRHIFASMYRRVLIVGISPCPREESSFIQASSY